jgi:biotin operon repressor
MSQTEIAHELQISKASISSDMQYLRKQVARIYFPTRI